MSAENTVKEFVERLIAEGDVVIASQWHPRGNYLLGPPTYVDLELFQQSRSRCRLLMSMLGTLADPWKPILASEAANKIESAKSTQGALKGVRQSLEEGLLIRFEDLANVDTVWYQTNLDVFLNRWFSNYEYARRARESDGGFLLRYKHHFFVCEAEVISAMGLEPDDPEWEKIKWDGAQPVDIEAYQRLCEKRDGVVQGR